jgi:hypothetical protein
MEAFFAAYADFEYNPEAYPTEEFRRLRQHYGFADRINPRALYARRFRDALVGEFNYLFGTNEQDLSNWHSLLAEVGVQERPTSKTACRKVRPFVFADSHTKLRD